MDPTLTLETARKKATIAERIKNQQKSLGENIHEIEINAVKKNPAQKAYRAHNPVARDNRTSESENPRRFQIKQCYRCGNEPHPKESCPAIKLRCTRCNMIRHLKKMCKSKYVNEVHGSDTGNSSDEEYYVNAVQHGKEVSSWNVDIKVDSKPISFKIDTGAECSILKWEDFSKLPSARITNSDVTLFGPGKEPLDIAGKVRVLCEYNKKKYHWKILRKITALQLINWEQTNTDSMQRSIRAVSVKNEALNKICQQYPSLFSGIGQVTEPYEIKLAEGAKPYAITCPRRVPITLRQQVKQEIDRLLKIGIIEPIDEPTDWCAGMVTVPKPNNQVRICVDLTKLNQNIKREKFLLPKVEESLALIGEKARIFSKLDARNGYWQIPITKESAKLTTFLTPFGRFFFKRLPMGLSSSAEHYERKMRETLAGIEGVVSSQDDALIFGENQKQHDERLHTVLKKLKHAGITLNREKCVISVNRVKFLGHIVSDKGVEVDMDKVEAVLKFKTPENISDIRSFLGLVAQHSKFLPNYSEISKPLRDLLIKDNDWTWDHAQKVSFEKLKQIVTKTPVLAFFDPNLDTRVTSDACNHGIGGLIEQRQTDGVWRPVSFCSRSLSDTEKRYAVLEKEALAATWVSERFEDYLTGIKYKMIVDHKPLVSLLGEKDLDKLTTRVQRFRMRLMRFNFQVEYQPGKILASADALSRYPVGKPEPLDLRFEKNMSASISLITSKINCSDLNIEKVREAQAVDLTSVELMKCIQQGWPKSAEQNPLTTNFFKVRGNLAYLDGLILYGERLYIPHTLRPFILSRLHIIHLGIEKCRRRARAAVWWPNLNNDVSSYIAACDICMKYSTNPIEPMIKTDFPTEAWREVGADVGYHDGKTYLLLQDYFSRYPEIVTLKSITSKAVIEACKSIFSRHGIPVVLRVDAGSQFTSKEFQQYAESWNIRINVGSPKHSRSNGLAESGEKTIKKLLKKEVDIYQGLLAYRSAPLESGLSSAELLMGRRIRTMIPQMNLSSNKEKEIFEKVARLKSRQELNFNRRHKVRDLNPLSPGEHVWIPDANQQGTVIGTSDILDPTWSKRIMEYITGIEAASTLDAIQMYDQTGNVKRKTINPHLKKIVGSRILCPQIVYRQHLQKHRQWPLNPTRVNALFPDQRRTPPEFTPVVDA
ncbi:Hypothetical Protein NTJ_02434 [Nesidiocoris tenuis]|uniref:RNA-directed DNA polymerase n=2 Tax=Nesidiocoris tenuis TaxID=355587 RepID=A0ABN7AFG7_9HEMI|nr:Hypothetical Protein NTJ_02434 [Nesidiocoris tenuis]